MPNYEAPNPYAGPQAPFEPPAQPAYGAAGGPPLPWTVGDALNWSFKALFSAGGRPAWQMAIPVLIMFGAMVPIYAVMFASMAGQVEAMEAAQAAGQPPMPPFAIFGMMGVIYPVMLFLNLWFMLGWTRYALQLGRGQVPTLGVLFKFDQLLPALGLAIVGGIAIYAGMILLIVPGMILMMGWIFAITLLVDRRLGPIEALKASWAMTAGSRWPLFGLLLLMSVVGMGLQMVCVGFFWSTRAPTA